MLACLLLKAGSSCFGGLLPDRGGNLETPYVELISAPQPTLQAAPIPIVGHTEWKPRFFARCDLGLNSDLAASCEAYPIAPATTTPSQNPLPPGLKPMVDTSKGRLHWRPALWQSLEFLVVEQTFRISDDSYARHLLIHKPFWHDYLASANDFDMDRWGDGDNFLVNYVGHPMEGAVAGDIFLQNDPRGRTARFGRNSAYWGSRLEAMAWAAVYSAYFEIGPFLSEAAIGNEGGYTYVPACGLYPCQEKPGVHYKPHTNNTGWVDYVITPVVGMGWIVAEDALEREFVDRIAKDSPAFKYKVLRGALAPSLSFANILAGKWPWYRYPDAETLGAAGTLEEPAHVRPAWKYDPQWGLGIQLIGMSLPVNYENCAWCQDFHAGVGVSFDYRFAKYAHVDAEANFFPNGGSSRQNSGVQEVLGGLKLGRQSHSWGLFAEIRPGMIHYDTALVPGSNIESVSTTRFAQNLAATAEYYPSRHSAIQFNLGTALVHYLEPYPDPEQPPVSVLSDQYYTFHGSLNVATGYQFRF